MNVFPRTRTHYLSDDLVTNKMETEWCKNCDVGQIKLNALKELAGKAVIQYDELLQKFDANQKQYAFLVERLKERDNQLVKLDRLMVPVYTEYEEIVNKYEIERGCRHEAEKYACQVVNQNKQLKRQSMDLLAHASIDFSKLDMEKIDEMESIDTATQEYTDQLNSKLKELEDEVSMLKSKLKLTEEDLEHERESSARTNARLESTKLRLNQSEGSIQMYDQAIAELATVSEEAYNEYEILQEKYELAAICKHEMEKKATEIKTQNEAIKRQSNVLMTSDVTSNMKLMKALGEVEDLTSQLDTQKIEFQTQITNMQYEQSEERVAYLKGLELENKKFREEREDLFNQLGDLESKYKLMEKLYKEMETKYEDATRPPPPPPPPPLPSVEKSKGYLRRIRSQRQTDENVKNILKTGGVVTDTNFSQALEEMMNRLKNGKSLKSTIRLKSTRSPSEIMETRPMQDLHSILKRFKRTKSEGDLLTTIESAQPESELAMAMRRIKKTQEGNNKQLSCVEEENLRDDNVFNSKI